MTSSTKYLLLSICILIISTVSAQEPLFQKRITRKLFQSEKFLPIVHEDQSTTFIWLNDYQISKWEFNAHFQLQDQLTFKKKDIPYRNLLGYSISPQGYHLFYSNSSEDQFYHWTILTKQAAIKGEPLTLSMDKKEKMLDATSYGSHFYLLTIKRQTSTLVLYDFVGKELASRKEIDFSAHKFGMNPKFPDLYSAIAEDGSISIPKVDYESPVAIELAARPVKLYHVEEKLFLTLDHDPIKTVLLSIDLTEGSGTHKIIRHQLQGCTDVNKIKSNSFLANNDFYQIQVCDQAMAIQARTLIPAKSLTTLLVSKNESIPFINTPIRQEGSRSLYNAGTDKELVKTKQILKKIADGYAGISAYDQNGQIVLSIGGYATSGSFLLFGPASSLRVSRYNPLSYALNQFGLSRTISFKSLLDGSTYDHVPAKVPENAFEKISAFQKGKSRITHKTLFKHGNSYIFGYLLPSNKTFYLHKFQDSI